MHGIRIFFGTGHTVYGTVNPRTTEHANSGFGSSGTQLGLKSSSFLDIILTLTFLGFRLSAVYEHVKQLNAAFRNVCARSEDRLCAMIVEVLIILCRNNTADADKDIFTAAFFQFFHDSRQEGLVTCRKRGKANHMDVVIHSILCRFFRRLEQRSYVDVPAHIGKGCRENLLASVVSVLPHLSQENTGTAAFQCFKSVGQFLCFFQFRGTVKFAGIYTGNSMDGSVETAGYFFNRIGNFTEDARS